MKKKWGKFMSIYKYDPIYKLTKNSKLLNAIYYLMLITMILLFMFHIAYDWGVDKETSRRQIIWAYNNISLGQTIKDVEDLFRIIDINNNQLTVYYPDKHIIRGDIAIATPHEMGAKNWILWIELQDGIITEIKIRFADEVKWQPEGSPPDKIASHNGSIGKRKDH